MNTWEMAKILTQNPGKKFISKVNTDLEATANPFTDYIKIRNIKTDVDIVRLSMSVLNGEWEEVKEPVTFTEVLEQVKNDNLMIVSFKHKELTFDYARCTLDYVLSNLSKFYESDVIARLLLEGKWYIED